MRKKAQTELKDAARNNQIARGDHPHRAGGQAGQVTKNTPGSTRKPTTELEKAQGQIFSYNALLLSFTALAMQNTHCCTAGEDNFRAQKSRKWVGLCLQGHHGKKATALLYDTSAGYLNPMA